MKSFSSNTAVSDCDWVLTELIDFNLVCRTELRWQWLLIFLKRVIWVSFAGGGLIKSFWLQTFWCKMRTHSQERLATRRVQQGLQLAVGEFESSEWKTRHILMDNEPFRHTISKHWHTRAAPDMSIGNLLQNKFTQKENLLMCLQRKSFRPLTNSFGNRRPSWQLQPRYWILVKVIDVGNKLNRQSGRRLMALENWLVMPTGTEHFHQMSVAVIIRQWTRRNCNAFIDENNN